MLAEAGVGGRCISPRVHSWVGPGGRIPQVASITCSLRLGELLGIWKGIQVGDASDDC